MSSKRIYQGRITELWSEDEILYAEFLVAERRLVLEVVDPRLIRGVERGTIARVTLEEGSHGEAKKLLALESLSNPRHELGSDSDSLRWRRGHGSASRMSYLWQRQKILSIIREDLAQEHFLEVETPLMVKGACPEAGILSIEITGEITGTESLDNGGYLVTSTEYQIKRMIVGGFEKLYTLTRNFRKGDLGRYHSSEFTMLEWARAFETLDAIEEDAVRFIRAAFVQLCPGKKALTYNECEIELLGSSWERLTVREALEKHLGLEDLGDFSLERLLKAAKHAGVAIPSNFVQDKHLVLSYLMDALQPHLGKTKPTFLREWPAFMTTSAEINEHDPDTAVRSELFIAGVEIADGFPFLRDSSAQLKYFERELARRQDENKPQVELDLKYVQALSEGIPPGAGMALGVDRLVMLLTGAKTITEVQAFSWEEL